MCVCSEQYPLSKDTIFQFILRFSTMVSILKGTGLKAQRARSSILAAASSHSKIFVFLFGCMVGANISNYSHLLSGLDDIDDNKNSKNPDVAPSSTTNSILATSNADVIPLDKGPLISDSCDPADVPDKYKEMFGDEIDVYTPFHEYFAKTMLQNCPDCPLAHKWVPYFEAYHNQFKRFRNREGGVTFMEIGVQSGGSISMWREYFGESLTYIGLDINPEVQRFDNADWINIHIGDSGDPAFLQKIRELYPDGVDILLDDGGHTMSQQINNFQTMTNFVKPDGIFACEDLATSWATSFGGVSNTGVTSKDFVDKTMVGRVHHSIDWLHAGFISGDVMSVKRTAAERPQDLYPDMPEYQSFLRDFKSIHVYNQIVFFQRGTYFQENLQTKGRKIPYGSGGGTYSGYKLPWDKVEKELSQILGEDKLTCAPMI